MNFITSQVTDLCWSCKFKYKPNDLNLCKGEAQPLGKEKHLIYTQVDETMIYYISQKHI